MLADVAIILFLVACMLLGFFRGALRQVLAIGAWFVALVVAAQGRNFLAEWLHSQKPDFSVQYSQMLGFLIGYGLILLAALAVIELTGRTISLSNRPIVEEGVGAVLMLVFGVLAVTGLLMALGSYYAEPNGDFTAEVDLLRQLNIALDHSTIVQVLRDTTLPWLQSLLGPMLPPDVRHFG